MATGAIKVHLSVTRTSAFGGERTTSLCERLRTLDDGMNLTGDVSLVTCKFCLKMIEQRASSDARHKGSLDWRGR